jgi:hypothetical protein
MPAKNTTRDGRATRINHEPEAEQIFRLLGDENTTEGQVEILSDALLELSNNTGVSIYSPEVVRAFYEAAAARVGAARMRSELRDVLALIAEGERFDDYRQDDFLRLWKARRRRQRHGGTQALAREITTKAEFAGDAVRRDLLARLQAFCESAGVVVDPKDLAASFIEAEADGERFEHGGRKFEQHQAARTRLLEFLSAIRKGRTIPTPDETPAADAGEDFARQDDAPAKVVDLSCWKQSHTRRVRTLFFAEQQ